MFMCFVWLVAWPTGTCFRFGCIHAALAATYAILHTAFACELSCVGVPGILAIGAHLSVYRNVRADRFNAMN